MESTSPRISSAAVTSAANRSAPQIQSAATPIWRQSGPDRFFQRIKRFRHWLWLRFKLRLSWNPIGLAEEIQVFQIERVVR